MQSAKEIALSHSLRAIEQKIEDLRRQKDSYPTGIADHLRDEIDEQINRWEAAQKLWW